MGNLKHPAGAPMIKLGFDSNNSPTFLQRGGIK